MSGGLRVGGFGQKRIREARHSCAGNTAQRFLDATGVVPLGVMLGREGGTLRDTVTALVPFRPQKLRRYKHVAQGVRRRRLWRPLCGPGGEPLRHPLGVLGERHPRQRGPARSPWQTELRLAGPRGRSLLTRSRPAVLLSGDGLGRFLLATRRGSWWRVVSPAGWHACDRLAEGRGRGWRGFRALSRGPPPSR